MKVGGAGREPGPGSDAGAGGRVFPNFSLLVALMAGHAHFFSLQESRLPCLP